MHPSGRRIHVSRTSFSFLVLVLFLSNPAKTINDYENEPDPPLLPLVATSGRGVTYSGQSPSVSSASSVGKSAQSIE